LVTLAALTVGVDYTLGLFFPGIWLLSLSRAAFPAIVACDLLCCPAKYAKGRPVFIVWAIAFMVCLPYIVFASAGASAFDSLADRMISLHGAFLYLLFFYVNCSDLRAASRICTILFCCGGVITAYVIGCYFGLVDGKVFVIRNGVECARVSGAFDPNIVAIYFLPCFAFGPLLAVHCRRLAGSAWAVALMVGLCLSLFAALQLNSRAGSVAVAAALGVSLTLRSLLSSQKRRSLLSAKSLAFVAIVVAALIGLQWQYGLFDTIVAVFEATDLSRDASFAFRIAAYRYLADELTTGPNLLGNLNGYAEYWQQLGIVKYPHCCLVDIYIKGGLVFLGLYVWLLGRAVWGCLRGTTPGQPTAYRAVCASLLAYLAGFLPLMMTLSVDTTKMPWAVVGCALGFVAGARQWANGASPQRKGVRHQLPQRPEACCAQMVPAPFSSHPFSSHRRRAAGLHHR